MRLNAITRQFKNGRDAWKMVVCFSAILILLNAYAYLRQLNMPGLPLDDAWIHQTYARNLAESGQMAFNPGEPSAGDTSPAWVFALALGYRLGVPPLPWAYALGSLFAVGVALMTWQLSSSYFASPVRWQLVALFSVLEWRLAWAALSGMEIMAFTFLTLCYLWLVDKDADPIWLGILGALITFVRPEALILSAGYALKLCVSLRKNPRRLVYAVLKYALPLVAILSPLVIFNLQVTGSTFPSTMLAKNAQYAFEWTPGTAASFLLAAGSFLVGGPLLLLCPFTVVSLYGAWRNRSYRLAMPAFWVAGVMGLYAVVLPTIPNNGRYLMPLIPFIIIFGMAGLRVTAEHFHRLGLFWKVYKAAIVVMVVALWLNKADSYVLQVRLLEDNHAQIARWIRANTTPQTVIATHDIGLLGYLGERRIVDLAGLVTPKIIPMLHKPQLLATFCRQNDVSYVVVFTGYYPEFLSALNARRVYSPDPIQLQQLGLEPLEVYAVN